MVTDETMGLLDRETKDDAEPQEERDALKKNNDQLELIVQLLNRQTRLLDHTREEIRNIQDFLSSEKFGSVQDRGSTQNRVSMINRMLAQPELLNPDFVATTTDKATSKSVSSLLPKWISGENVRNYTQRVKHTWQFVKGDFNEQKFCSLVRIGASAQLGEIIDNYLTSCEEANETATVDKLCEDLVEKLDKRPSEYISEFKNIQKHASESYSSFAHRLQELYKKGTETKGKMGQGERRMLVEQFFDGIPYEEAATLKMVATDEEMLDVTLLALRAGRSTPN